MTRPANACIAGVLIAITGVGASADSASCKLRSAATVTPVIELYTSEGCSSCPPADQWLSGLRQSAKSAPQPVVQAFHVGYWDYIGWVDRFASPVHTTRQRQIAAWNGQRSIYTPQLVLDGRDWRDWHTSAGVPPRAAQSALVTIDLHQRSDNHFEASVSSQTEKVPTWGAYWTVTEHGHQSKVQAGENAGAFLQHDFVVRQYVPLGQYDNRSGAAQTLTLRAVAASAGHTRQVNLVVFDPRSGKTLQAIAAGC